MNPHTLTALKRLGMHCVGWSKSAKDAGNRRLNTIRRIGALAAPGEVILCHDCLPKPEYKQEILDQVEKLCINIKERNLGSARVEEMFEVEAYE